jgi:hypothetical protein
MKLKCLFGHKWQDFYEIKNGDYIKKCIRCDKEILITKEQYDIKQLINTKSLAHNVEIIFKVIDYEMIKGFYSNCDEKFDTIHDVIVKSKKQYSEHFNLIRDAVENGINYIKRPVIKNPFEYETCYNGVWYHEKVGPEFIPPHKIPESITKQFERLTNEINEN